MIIAAQHSVHPTGGSLRVFKQFLWLKAGSVKAALSRPTHQRVTPAVGTLLAKQKHYSGKRYENKKEYSLTMSD